MINKETEIYCSFSSNPGNNGCIFFNSEFKELNMNAIYKSFYSDDIKKSIKILKKYFCSNGSKKPIMVGYPSIRIIFIK